MWIVAAGLAAVYVLSTAPTPLYETYRQTFGFSKVVLTLVYAVYVSGTIVTMFFFGRLSDQVGRRPVTLGAVVVAGLASVLFLVARGTIWLFAARVLSGLGIALASGASTAWIVELHPGRDSARATQIALAANCLGLTVGPLMAGLLAAYAYAPLRLPYVVCLLLLVPAAALTAFAQETVEERKALHEASMRPRLGVPRHLRREFAAPAVAAFATFAVLGFYSALIPGLMERALQIESSAAAGAVVAGLFLVAAATIASFPPVSPRSGMISGLALLLPGIACLVTAEAVHSLALLLVATAVGGVATGLGYRFGLQVVNEMSPTDQRSEIISSYLIVCYAAISLPVVGAGLLAGAVGSMAADAIFGALVAVLGIAALAVEARSSRRSPRELVR
jgi:MFS family permease